MCRADFIFSLTNTTRCPEIGAVDIVFIVRFDKSEHFRSCLLYHTLSMWPGKGPELCWTIDQHQEFR